jgi:pyrroloquinoline quinone biosynthesis protein D
MPLDTITRPRLWRLARIGFDRVRQRPVLLYPEGAMFLNETGKAILELCDGSHTVAEIIRILGERYTADVNADVTEFLDTMIRRDLIVPSTAAVGPTGRRSAEAPENG